MKQGDRIRLLRNTRGISQEYMASKLKITQPSYANIESDKTKLSVTRLKEIATILQVKIEDIMNFDDGIRIENVSNSQVGSGQYYEKVGNLKQFVSSFEVQIEYLKSQLKEKDILINNLIKKNNV